MEVANTLAYYNMATITAVKIFIVQAPGVNVVTQYCSNLGNYHSNIVLSRRMTTIS
jgi:hypothetical protein